MKGSVHVTTIKNLFLNKVGHQLLTYFHDRRSKSKWAFFGKILEFENIQNCQENLQKGLIVFRFCLFSIPYDVIYVIEKFSFLLRKKLNFFPLKKRVFLCCFWLWQNDKIRALKDPSNLWLSCKPFYGTVVIKIHSVFKKLFFPSLFILVLLSKTVLREDMGTK